MVLSLPSLCHVLLVRLFPPWCLYISGPLAKPLPMTVFQFSVLTIPSCRWAFGWKLTELWHGGVAGTGNFPQTAPPFLAPQKLWVGSKAMWKFSLFSVTRLWIFPNRLSIINVTVVLCFEIKILNVHTTSQACFVVLFRFCPSSKNKIHFQSQFGYSVPVVTLSNFLVRVLYIWKYLFIMQMKWKFLSAFLCIVNKLCWFLSPLRIVFPLSCSFLLCFSSTVWL